MVASAHRISRGSDFSRTLKSGVRVSTRDLTVHLLDRTHDSSSTGAPAADPPLATVGGPWLGLIVTKSVGNAVIRHRVARRLRAAFRETMAQCPSDQSLVVVRARPSSVECDSAELGRQLTKAYRKRAAA